MEKTRKSIRFSVVAAILAAVIAAWGVVFFNVPKEADAKVVRDPVKYEITVNGYKNVDWISSIQYAGDGIVYFRDIEGTEFYMANGQLTVISESNLVSIYSGEISIVPEGNKIINK